MKSIEKMMVAVCCAAMVACVSGCAKKEQTPNIQQNELKWEINLIDHSKPAPNNAADNGGNEAADEVVTKTEPVIKGYTDTEDEPEIEADAETDAEPEIVNEPEPEFEPESEVVEEATEIAEPVQQEPAQPEQPAQPAMASTGSVAEQMAARPGMIGRFSIPAVGIDVAVFYSDSQAVADAADSACCFDWLGYRVFGDHNYQGWSSLAYCAPGSTKAYFNDGANVTTYVCTANFTGINTGTQFCDDSGNPIGGATLVTYTCLGADWTKDRFCYWEIA